MNDSPPDWAMSRAYSAWCAEPRTQLGEGGCRWQRAFAHYIAAHEDGPSDPLQGTAEAIASAWVNGEIADDPIAFALVALRRGIELGKEQVR